VRSALIGEIRADEDKRAARVDRLLAEIRAADCEAATATIDDTRSEVGG
jgi:type II secretory pathway component PulM